MKIINTILESDQFSERPPVLVDIGASGEINSKWNPISKFSVCLAFDGDDREFHIREENSGNFKRLLTLNRILTSEKVGSSNFYLTKSPFCSSLLEPDLTRLRPWIFKDLFEVKSIVRMPGLTLEEAINGAGVEYIDWFKSDTQGTDLRLFKTMPQRLKGQILAAEFEPGIMDAYKDEDKLYQVMKEMEEHSFWLSTMIVKGTQRISQENARKFGTYLSSKIIKTSPGWAEICYLRSPEGLNSRQLFLLYIFAILEKQFGFALEVCEYGILQFSDPLWLECKKAISKKIKLTRLRFPAIMAGKKISKFFQRSDA